LDIHVTLGIARGGLDWEKIHNRFNCVTDTIVTIPEVLFSNRCKATFPLSIRSTLLSRSP